MKIRNGFVSNSSVSSFFVFGTIMTEEMEKEIKKNYIDKTFKDIPEKVCGCEHKLAKGQKFCKECGAPAFIDNPDREDEDDLDFYSILEDLDFEFHTDGEENNYIGINPNTLDENLSVKENKEKLAERLFKCTGVKVKPDEIEFIGGVCEG